MPLLSVPVPSVVLPSLNVTLPVAADGNTVAVNFTDARYVDGFDDEESVVDVFVFPNVSPLRQTKMKIVAIVRC